ncbi:hypothetical protein MMYC01_204094 [Madurella mycetomatis]|uniref:Uncharacterized protein n=1 Tax=Madurella mycetomatis TaxID=100816 RepID=A0A175W2Y0_9PEZI|nr:hypothetical protein MMYC01_204800 [Madurella mycetomatis]KXX81103.1 hypothetical protein MMYC01_204094 [Madurella mycetomatis]
MKFSTVTILTALGLGSSTASAQSVQQRFHVYWSQDTVSGTGAWMYYFFGGEPSCNDVFTTRGVFEQSNLDNREGVICQGNGCWNGRPHEITRFEFNAPNFGRYNIEQITNGQFALMSTDGRWVGACQANRDDTFVCGAPFAMTGVRFFICERIYS